jgi:outer membrane protein
VPPARGNGNLINPLNNSENYSVNSSVVLWNDNYINNDIRQQGLLIQSAGISVQQAQNNITLSITQAYLNILSAKENEKYIMDLASTSDSKLDPIEALHDE